MKLKKSHFPFFIFILVLLCSCTRKPSVAQNAETNYDNLVALGRKLGSEQQYDSAFYYYNKAKDEPGISADERVYALICMAEIQRMFSDFSGSESTVTEALDDLPKTKADYYTSAFNLLGIGYKEQSDFNSALKYYNLSLEHTADPLQSAIVKNNIAVVHMDKKAFNKAVQILHPLLQDTVVKTNAETHARILDNAGYAYFNMGAKDALGLLEQALQIRLKIADDYGIIASYHHLSQFYAQANPGKAKDYALSAYQTASRVNSAADRLETLEQLIENTSGNEVKPYSLIYVKLSDSLSLVRQQAKNQFAKIRYDDARTKVENANLKIDKIQMANRSIVFLILFCSAVILGILSYVFIRKKHKKEKIIEGYKAETKISKKIHDELANDIYNTITYTETEAFTSEAKENLLRRLDEVYTLARDISRENSPIATDESYPLQLRHMLEDYSSLSNRVLLRGIDAIEWDVISDVKKRQ